MAGRPPPPPPPPGSPPRRAPWLGGNPYAAESESDGSVSEDDDELSWSRGEKLLTDDGCLTARRLSRPPPPSAQEQPDDPWGDGERDRAPQPLDDYHIDLRCASEESLTPPADEAEASAAPPLPPAADEAEASAAPPLPPAADEAEASAAPPLPPAADEAEAPAAPPLPPAADEAEASPLPPPANPSTAALLSAFRADEAELSRLPWRRVVLRLSAAGVAPSGRLLWHDALRQLEPHAAVRLRCAAARAQEWVGALLAAAGAEACAPPPPPRRGARALCVELAVRARVAVRDLSAEADGSLLLRARRAGGGAAARRADRLRLRLVAAAEAREVCLTVGAAAGELPAVGGVPMDALAAALPHVRRGGEYTLHCRHEGGGQSELAVEVVAHDEQRALLPDGSEVLRELEPGEGSMRAGDEFEVELAAAAADDDGNPTGEEALMDLILSSAAQDGQLCLRSTREAASPAATATVERAVRAMQRESTALLSLASPLRLPAIGEARQLRLRLRRVVRVVRLAVDWPGGAASVRKRCVSPRDMARLEAAAFSPAMFGIASPSAEDQPVQDDFELTLALLLPPADGAPAPAAPPPRVVVATAGACDLGAAWEPLLSSLAFRGEMALFDAPAAAAAQLRRGAEACPPPASPPPEVDAAEWAALAAACGGGAIGALVLRLRPPPDKLAAPPDALLAHLRALRRAAAALFARAEPRRAALKLRRALWTLLELPARPVFHPADDGFTRALLAPPRVFHPRLLPLGEPQLAELWLAAALGLAACALAAGEGRLASLACAAAVREAPASAEARVRLAHALYAERDLDGALDALREAVRLRPAHAEARQLHAHIARLRALLRAREAARRKAAFKTVLR
ncbi:hypothetical protein AB1Y20_019669 [Prymnesium parvum]|uniref:Uncharacterized protein n=1 Tax=Prymnesium parvum TaxID=97485 RepID=A0AB34JUS7_PRYPA